MSKVNVNRWINIKLVGTASTRYGVGTKVIVEVNGLKQFREMNDGGGGKFFSQGSGPMYFRLAQATIVESLTIKLPNGIIQTLVKIDSNQIITVME